MRWRFGRLGTSLVLATPPWIALCVSVDEGSRFDESVLVRLAFFLPIVLLSAAVVYACFTEGGGRR